MMGMLKASQKRTNRAPFTEELMSKQPDKQDKYKMDWMDWGFFFLTVSYSHIFLTWSYFGLITHNAYSASIHTGKSHHNVFGVVGHDLKEFPLIYYLIKKKNFFKHTQKGNEMLWYILEGVCLCAYCMNYVQHVVGFSWL